MVQRLVFVAVLFAVCAFSGEALAQNRQRNAEIPPAVATIMLERLTTLWEKGCLQTFAALDDSILDAAVVQTFSQGDSPVADRLLTPQTRPDIFAAAGRIDGMQPDVALHRRDAAEIARFYFGRPARLAGVQGDYLFGNMADGPRICRAATAGITADAAGGVVVTGDILCMDDPETEALTLCAWLRVLLVQDASAPLGWQVQSVTVSEPASGDYVQETALGVVWARDLPSGTQYESLALHGTAPQVSIVLLPRRPVQDLQVLRLEFEGVDDAGKLRFKTHTLHSRPSLMPEQPLLLGMNFFESMPQYGIAYREADGTQRQFAIQESGMDGSLELLEF